MSEEAIGTVGEHTSLNDGPGVSLTDLVQTEADPIAQGNNNVHGQSGSRGEWFWSDNEAGAVAGKGDAPEWFNSKTFKTVEDQAKAHGELRKLYNQKMKGLSGAPDEGYEYEMPEEYTSKEWKYNTDDPGYQDFLHLARENGFSQDLVNEMTDMLVQNTNMQREHEGMRNEESISSEMDKLSMGDTEAFESAIRSAANNPNVQKEDLNVLLDNLNNAEAIKAFTSLMNEHNYSYVPGPEVGRAPDLEHQQDTLRSRLSQLSGLRGAAKESAKRQLYRDYEDIYPGEKSFG